jgi:diguanylate cyclase (GGDEF)-like protein
MVAKVTTVIGQRWYDISAKLCSDSVTGRPAVLITETDVSELKNARDKASYLADRDQLTGCYNRSYLQQHMAMLAKFQTERCALLSFDVDRFKQINDRLGHEMGDAVLKEIAARVSIATRSNDIVVRLGGDEFVVVFEDIPSNDEFEQVIDRLLKTISEPIEYEETRINATVSMGISTFVPRQVDLTAVLREADIALYGSKQAGRNRVTFFNAEMGKKAKARNQIEVELKKAVENQEFELFFQPRVDLKSDTVVSAEALVRWHHPDRGIVMPSEFIPVCEETGLIEDLGQQIVEMGCEQAIAWGKNGLDIGISINISPRQFQDKRLLNSLRCFSERPDFPRDKIELEITESVLIGNNDQIEGKLDAISKMGYQIAIDDFGTGYSNLSYISRFSLNCLKIDQSFVNQLPKSGPIMSLIITLAEQIGACVVAEGVETKSQMEWLQENGCSQVQGYYVSKPIPIDEFQEAITTGRFKRFEAVTDN